MKNVRPVKEYLWVYFSLMVLLGLTLGSAFIDLGVFNPFVNLGISAIKASLVIVFFMHVGHERPLTKVFASAGIFWLAILFSLVATDYISRGWIPLPGHWPQNQMKQETDHP